MHLVLYSPLDKTHFYFSEFCNILILFTGKQSNVSVTDMLQLGNPKRPMNRKQPLSELHMNTQDRIANQNMQVASLKDSKKSVTASSAGSINTVISLDKLKIGQDEPNVPALVVTEHSIIGSETHGEEDVKVKRQTRSKSPSSKSQSTLSTVHENFASFKSADSPLQSSKGMVLIYFLLLLKRVSNVHVYVFFFSKWY